MLRHTVLAVVFFAAVSGFAAQGDDIETAKGAPNSGCGQRL